MQHFACLWSRPSTHAASLNTPNVSPWQPSVFSMLSVSTWLLLLLTHPTCWKDWIDRHWHFVYWLMLHERCACSTSMQTAALHVQLITVNITNHYVDTSHVHNCPCVPAPWPRTGNDPADLTWNSFINNVSIRWTRLNADSWLHSLGCQANSPHNSCVSWQAGSVASYCP